MKDAPSERRKTITSATSAAAPARASGIAATRCRWSFSGDRPRIVLSPSERSVPFYRRAGFRDATELLVLPLA